MNYARRERGTFTKEELAQLFTEVPGVWEQFLAYCVFNKAARTGMRAGELLALKWDAVDFSAGTIDIHRAWQGSELADQVKSLKRVIPVSTTVMEPLATLQEEGIRVGEDDLVFCYEYNGHRLGNTWWHKRFVKAIETFGIDYKDHNITGHSLRL